MKKSIYIPYLLVFILSVTNLIAQPDWQWGQEVRFNAKSIAVDTYGNSYVVWSLQDPYEIDGELFISHGAADVAMTSFDCDGTHRWTKTFGGQTSDSGIDVQTDTVGGVYLVANVNGGRQENYSVNMDTDTTVILERKGLLLIKYNTLGEFQWFRMPEDTVIFDINNLNFAFGFQMDVAPNGDCYVYGKLPAGSYENGSFDATFEGTAYDGEDIYALKYDSDGNCTGGIHFDMWYDGGFFTKSYFVRDHHTGRFYVSGYRNANDIFIFGGEEVTANNYVVQFDNNGFVNWNSFTNDVRFWGKPSVDEFGNLYVTGGSANGNSLGDFTFQNTIGTSDFPIFAKIDSMGSVVYATNASVDNNSGGKATSYVNNQVAVTGNFAGAILWGDFIDHPDNSQLANVFIATFESFGTGLPTNMNVLYGSANGNELPSLLTSDRQGNFYVGGNFSGQLHVGDGTLYNQTGTQEGFIAKFGSDSCYCPLPQALFAYDSIPNEAGYNFAYTGSADVDSVVWNFGDGQTGTGLNPYHFFAESGDYTVCATAYNNCGTDTVCLTIPLLGPVGLSAISQLENIRLYPNPAKELLYIDHDVPGNRVEVINAVGQILLSTTLPTGTAQIDVSKLPAGLYILRFTDGTGTRGYARFVRE